MEINIGQPPDNIPRMRRKYRHASLMFLGLAFFSIILGAVTIFYDTQYDGILEYAAFTSFIASGFVFVYFTEKLMGYRRLSPGQKKELQALAEEYREIAEYCRKVAWQNRYVVVNEYDLLVAHVEKIRSSGTDFQGQ
ncbi:MAG: hypothetical protein SCH71_11860 [Desulfobulbaceae bacterium]|nr:hypothetical protein [Desulfobulbaceae bacterium]